MHQEFIFKNSTSEQVLTSDITDLFGQLHQKLQAVANSELFDLDGSRVTFAKSVSPGDRRLWQTWKSSGRKDRRQLIQAELFSLIHKDVLEVDIFGAANGCDVENSLEFRLQEMEQFFKVKGG
jgi:GTP cyclohydrolase II